MTEFVENSGGLGTDIDRVTYPTQDIHPADQSSVTFNQATCLHVGLISGLGLVASTGKLPSVARVAAALTTLPIAANLAYIGYNERAVRMQAAAAGRLADRTRTLAERIGN